jgi:hypothetical protein
VAEPQSADQTLLANLDTMIGTQEDQLSIPYTRVNQAVVDIVQHNAKPVVKMVDRIIRALDKHTTVQADKVNAVQTTVLAGLESWLFNQEQLLQNLAVKGGVIQPGDTLDAALEASTTEGGGLTYQGSLLLEIAKLEPWLGQLIEVLREIRDRLPPSPIRTPGETPATAAETTIGTVTVTREPEPDRGW